MSLQYLCSCGKDSELWKLHFCKHCLQLRCRGCLQHEVDVVYCENCLETQTREESNSRKNRCVSCYTCPCCGQNLAVRATFGTRVNVSDGGNPALVPTQNRVFYLLCGTCRWTNRDADIPDQTSSTGGWVQSKVSPYQARISVLCESYSLYSSMEKIEKEAQRYTHKKSSASFHNRFAFSAHSRRRSSSSAFMANVRPIEIPEAVASEEVEALDEDLFLRQPLVIDRVANIVQRLRFAQCQPELMSDLKPRHSKLSTTCSLRCRDCDHNVSKHDMGFTKSMKFKINMNALYNVPMLRVSQLKMDSTEKVNLLLTISNPFPRNISVTLNNQNEMTSCNWKTNAKMVVPDGEITITARSEVEMTADTTFSEPPSDPVIASRQIGKVALYLQCITSTERPIRATFSLQFDAKSSLNLGSTLMSQTKTLGGATDTVMSSSSEKRMISIPVCLTIDNITPPAKE